MFYNDTAIGPGFLTPEQSDFRKARTRIGGPDDPNVGSFHLSRIHWNKESGAASFSTTDVGGDGWYTGCGCEQTSGGCGCG